MRNGLYKVAFSYAGNSGTGVIVLQDGKVRGGDTSFAYVGDIDHQGEGAVGLINISRHSEGLPNVFGIDSYQLTVSAKASDTHLKGTAETLAAPGATLIVEMTLIVED